MGSSGNGSDTVSVSSVVYNLAGPEENRVDFLKSLVVGAVQQEASISESIKTGYLKGPGIRYKRFADWTKTNTEFISKFGITSGKLSATGSINLDTVKNGISLGSGQGSGQVVDTVQSSEVRLGQIHFWVLQYMYLHRPGDPIPQPIPFLSSNTYSYNSSNNTVILKFSPSDTVIFTPADYDPSQKYLYTKYIPGIPSQELGIEYGPMQVLAPGDPDPNFGSGWIHMGDQTAGVFTANLTSQDTVDSTYSDGRTPSHYEYPVASTAASMPTSYVHYTQNSYQGTDTNGAKYSIRTHKEFWRDYEVASKTETQTTVTQLSGGVTRTTVQTRVSQYLREIRRVRVSTQKVYWKTLLDPQWHIYRYQTGNTVLDGVMGAATQAEMGSFYPPIPFRYDNKTVGPRKKTATRWYVNLGQLGFDWDEDSYDPVFGNDLDIRVAPKLNSAEDKFISLVPVAPVPSRGPGWFVVESRDPQHPLYRLFGDSTAAEPGVFKIVQRSGSSDPWSILQDVQKLKSTPEPNVHGIDEDLETLYPFAKKAFKRAYGASYDRVLDSLLENDNIADIDYAYAVFGVSLNTKENSCRKYVYQFLRHLMLNGGGNGATEADSWMESYQAAHDSRLAWFTWWAQTHAPGGVPVVDHQDSTGHATEPPAEPVRLPYPSIPWKVLKVESVHENVSDYRTELRWAFIDENFGTGVLMDHDGKLAKPGELFFTINPDPIQIITGEDNTLDTPDEYKKLNNQVTLNWQLTENTWKQLVITGLCHTNFIYQNHSVTYTAEESVNWKDESGAYKESPFIVPLHETVYRSMSLVDATQMGTACTFMVLNCYAVQEKAWYQSTWFKVVVFVVTIAIAIAAAFFTGGASLGVAGSAASGLATTLGASATAGLIIGILADIAVSMAVSYLTEYIATMLFGEKVGSIVGSLVGLFTGALLGGADLDGLSKLLSSADGIMSLSLAVTQAGSQYLQYQTQETLDQLAKTLQQASKEAARIQEVWQKEFGKSQVDLTVVRKYINEVLEKPDMFLNRTLMIGSDVVAGTLSEIDSFVENRLQLALP